MKARPSKICVICGLQPATTDDHVPPQGIFPKPRPSDLIKVRACLKCNKRTSDLDEVFKVFIGIASGHGSEGEKMFKQQTIRTLQHNRRLKREIASTICDVWVKPPGGIALGKRPAVLLDSKAHDQIIEKTIRGLHFHHTGVILGEAVDIKVNWHYSLTKDMFDMSSCWPIGVVGDGQFIYKFVASQAEPKASVWICLLYTSPSPRD